MDAGEGICLLVSFLVCVCGFFFCFLIVYSHSLFEQEFNDTTGSCYAIAIVILLLNTRLHYVLCCM